MAVLDMGVSLIFHVRSRPKRLYARDLMPSEVRGKLRQGSLLFGVDRVSCLRFRSSRQTVHVSFAVTAWIEFLQVCT